MRLRKTEIDKCGNSGASVAALEAAWRPDPAEKPCRIRLDFAVPRNPDTREAADGIAGGWLMTGLVAFGACWAMVLF